nr:MAG TPA: AAA domain protein [Caudoviricetes sp.]DAR79622.1 MAG TPA: AAA domain protein [Caudoviricetes sp.]
MAGFAGIDIVDVNEEQPDFGRWLILGPQGGGKTTLASTIGELGKTLFIDLMGEKGTKSFRNAPYAKNIDVIRPESITALDDVFWALDKGGHPYKAVVIDSLTAAQKMTMRFLTGASETAVREIRQGTAPADQRTWGQSLDIMTDMAVFWYGLADGNRSHPMHVVMTAQVKMIEDEINGGVRRQPDVQKGALSIVRATPDYIVYADVEENIDAISDESQPSTNHIVRFGTNPDYGTKARLPYDLRGKIPEVLGRKKPVTLGSLSKVLGVGGVSAKKPASKTATTSKKEQ